MAATAKDKEWWKTAVFYQIYPRSFCDSNGDGIGDIPGIISKLQYLKDLGIDAIWLNPVYASPNCDFGYDISNYKDIHPDYGTMADMDKLILKAKRLGIRIVMDLVINHTSDEHEWFKAALAGDEKHRDYYYFRKGKGKKTPNNWNSFFGESVWEATDNGEYYLHLFHRRAPDLNWHNPDVYNEFLDIMKFWLDKGIAGFRFGIVNMIFKDSLDNGVRSVVLTGREHYIITSGCHDLLNQFYRDLWKKYGAFTVGEGYFLGVDTAKLLTNHDRNELNIVFAYEHLCVDWTTASNKWITSKYNPKKMIEILDKWQLNLEWNANYLENHDQVRSINHFGNAKEYWKESAKLLCGLNLSLRGTPFIYEGQEIGMVNCDFKSLKELRDSESISVYNAFKKVVPGFVSKRLVLKSTRDNARTPMQWDSSEGAGFTSGDPWLKINSNKSYINVNDEEADEDSILNFYKKMIDFRKESPALSTGKYRRVASEKDVYVFTREAFEERLYVYCNMTPYYKDVEFFGDKLVLDNYPEEQINDVCLRPYEFRIVRSNY